MAEEQIDAWPRWAPVAAAVPAVVLAGLTPVVHARGDPSPAVYALLAVTIVPWVLEAAGHRVGPWPFAALALVPLAVINWAGGSFGLDMSHDAQLSLMLVVWAVGCAASTNPPRVSVPIVGLALLIPLVRFAVHPFDGWVFWVAGVLMAAVTGLLLNRQQQILAELRATQDALAAEAVSAERRRIAREVHDVIAHHLTVTMLHLTAARMALHRDGGAAEEALAEAERLGRQALADVRRTVGLLHDGAGAGTGAALPGAPDVRALVAGYRAAGVDVELICDADVDELTPAAGLAVYRCVQEGLANATRHAPGADVTVSLRRTPDGLRVDVADAGGDHSAGRGDGGLGLVGMRERVEALGGTMTAGPSPDGWLVSCTFPAERAAAV